MAGYPPGRGPGRERPARYRAQDPGAYTGDGRSWAGGSQPAGTRRDDGYPGDRYPRRGTAGRHGAVGYRGGYVNGDDADGYATGRSAGRYAPSRQYRHAARPGRRDTTGGAEGNERLTAVTGAVLLVLLAAEGFTILAIHQLLTLHFFVGVLLVGPVVLKTCSTVYRFVRYYSGAPGYRRKGPPALLMRLLGPFVLLLSLAVIGTGIALAVTGPGPGAQLWMLLHKATFVLWFGAMSIHVLAYVWRLPRLISGDLASRAGARAHDVLAGRPARWLLLTASLLAGLLLAVVTVHLSGAWAGFAGGG